MVYSKMLTSEETLKGVRYNPAQFMKFANFVPFTRPQNREVLLGLLKDNPKILADFAAAVVTQLHYRDQAYQDHTSADSYVETLCDFFHKSIQGKGFLLVPEISKLRLSGSKARWIVVVAGCQTREVYTSRVAAAYQFMKELQPEEEIVVFSGANPAAQKEALESGSAEAVTLNEAAEMHAVYLSLKRHDRKKPKVPEFELVQETKAATSLENVARAFGSLNLNPLDNNICVIVTSLFHIGRLGSIAEAFFKRTALPVSRLLMIGAENPLEYNEAKMAQQYIKSATFEMLTEMFSGPPEQLFVPRTY